MMHQWRNIIYYNDLLEWWDKHHALGGSVYECHLPWDFFPNPESMLKELFIAFANLNYAHIENFVLANIFDNDMDHRDTMEDASKIVFLVEQIEDYGKLKYTPQVVHEPWYDRYRVHPGSGRFCALWLTEANHLTCTYTHFDEPCFEVPPYSQQIYDIEGMMQAMSYLDADSIRTTIDVYDAFPKDPHVAQYANERDSVWEPDRVTTHKDWQFVRYSEGNSFVESKLAWRNRIIDAWCKINDGSSIINRKLNL